MFTPTAIRRGLSLCPQAPFSSLASTSFPHGFLTNNFISMNKNLLKTFLVAMGLAVGVNGAWAEETTKSYDFEDESPLLTVYDGARPSLAVVDDEERGSKVLNYTCGNTNAIAFAYYDFADLVKGASKLSFSFSCNVENISGQGYISLADASMHTATDGGFTGKTSWGYGRSGSIIAIGSDRGRLDGKNNENYFAVNGVAKAGSTLELKTDVVFGVWLDVDIDVDLINKKVSYTISKDGENLVSEDNIDYYDSNAGTCSQLDIYTGNKGTILIDDISITSYKDEAAEFADYVVSFFNETKQMEISNSVRSGIVGAQLSLLPNDIEDFFSEDGTKKYIYVSNDAAGKTIAADGTTKVVVTFREAATYNYTISASVAGQTFEIAKGSDFEGEAVTFNYPRYYNIDGALYEIPNCAYTKDFYRNSVELTEDNQIITVSGYEEAKTNVVFYSEAEDIETLEAVNVSNANIRASMGVVARNTSDEPALITTLPAGKYVLSSSVWGSKDVDYVFKAGGNTVLTLTTTGSIADASSEEFVLSGETQITLDPTSAQGVDFVVIERTGDYAVTKTVPDFGYVTFSASVPVTVPEGVTVYKGAVNDEASAITITEVNTDVIPANTGVLLGAAAGEIVLTQTENAGSEADFDGNEFLPTSLITAIPETGNYYVLSQSNGEVVFAHVVNGMEVSPDKAYIPVPETAEPSAMRIMIDGSTTGISEIDSAETAGDGAYYTLQGVKVENPTKGLYIHNGKKVIIK